MYWQFKVNGFFATRSWATRETAHVIPINHVLAKLYSASYTSVADSEVEAVGYESFHIVQNNV